MHTVELLEECLQVARQLGYHVRHEWLGGVGGGACEFGGRRWIFLDLALNTSEQLEQATRALRADPQLAQVALSPSLTRLFQSNERRQLREPRPKEADNMGPDDLKVRRAA